MRFVLLVLVILLAACQPTIPAFPGEEYTRAQTAPIPQFTPTPGPTAPPSSSSSEVNSTTPLFTWESTSPCAFLTVYEDSIIFGECDAPPRPLTTSMAEKIRQQVTEWVSTYPSIDGDTPAGKVTLRGQGKIAVPPSILRQMAEWAKEQWEIAMSERTGAAWNMIFTFSRMGGFAGFCDNLVVYANGEVILTSCKGNRELRFLLSPEQLQQMYTWVDRYASYEFRYADPSNVADGMTITWTFAGDGSQPVDEATQQEMQEFLGTLLNKLYLP